MYNFNAIYVVANKTPPSKSVPLIVHIHDGPYEMSTTGFNPIFVTLVDIGFAVLSINYRGSIGNSDLVLQSILGNIDQVSSFRRPSATQIIGFLQFYPGEISV